MEVLRRFLIFWGAAAVLPFFMAGGAALGQIQFEPHTIAGGELNPGSSKSVFAIDIDRDGDTDALSAAYYEISWYENDGGENLTTHDITFTVFGPTSVFAIDIDGDTDTDVG